MKNNTKFLELPLPTKNNPYAQVDYIFTRIAETKNSKSTKSNYYSGLKYYKKFLIETNNYDDRLKADNRFYLQTHWDEFALIKVKEYVDQTNKPGTKGYRSSNTIVGYICAIRIVLKEALLLGLFSASNIIDVVMEQGIRETDINIAYSDNEFKQIQQAVKEELKYSYKVYRKEGYRYSGVGQDPRIRLIGDRSSKWNSIDNMRWYFENVLKCIPELATDENRKKHRGFFDYAPSEFFMHLGGIRGIYRHWGVTITIDSDIIMPLVVQLTIQTGLNIQSVLDLDIDCFDEKNPITGVPSIKYYKIRSGGMKEMNTNISSKDKLVKEYRHNQAKIIKNTLNVILSLTEEIRDKAPESIKNKLIIVQEKNREANIKTLRPQNTHYWCQKFIDKYNLVTDNGERLAFNLQRLRSTKITELLNQGVDIFEIQYEMGQKNIKTTLDYISKNKLNPSIDKETSKALNKIFENKSWAEKNNPVYTNSETSNGNSIFKGFACDCKNPFNPPENVRKLKEYREGQACNRINMCLFCENVIVFKKNLPLLWVYKRQIEVALERTDNELPNHSFYLKSLDILNALFDSENSEFKESDIEWAIKTAENLDELIDPVTYIPISIE